MSEQKCSQKNRIRLVEHSFAEVSDPSEVLRFVQEWIFKVVKEVKVICVRSILSCSRVPTTI